MKTDPIEVSVVGMGALAWIYAAFLFSIQVLGWAFGSAPSPFEVVWTVLPIH